MLDTKVAQKSDFYTPLCTWIFTIPALDRNSLKIVLIELQKLPIQDF